MSEPPASGIVPLSEATLAAWTGLFQGQEARVRALVESVREELDAIPEAAIWNGWFESGDAELYYGLLREVRPAAASAPASPSGL